MFERAGGSYADGAEVFGLVILLADLQQSLLTALSMEDPLFCWDSPRSLSMTSPSSCDLS